MNCVLFAKMDQVFSQKKTKTLKKYWKNGEKILEKSGKSLWNLVSLEKCETMLSHQIKMANSTSSELDQ